MLLFVFLSTVATPALALHEIAIRHRQQLAGTLEAILATSQEALQIWAGDRKMYASIWADSPDVRDAVRRQLAIPRSSDALRESRGLGEVSLDVATRRLGFVGVDVLAPDGTTIWSTRPNAVGTQDLVRCDRRTVTSALAGEVVLGLPFRPADMGGDPRDRSPLMLVAAPVRDGDRKVIAALTFVLDPSHEFTPIMALGRVSDSGETYAFDAQGRLLTQSRFDEHLRGAGLISASEQGILSIEIRDPGGNLVEGYHPALPRSEQPFTRMAQSAIAGHAGIDIEGYRDYRGVTVVGAWLWKRDLGLGLATEIDMDDAYSVLSGTHRLTLLMFGSVVAGVIAVGLLLLQRARDLSESVAREATARGSLEQHVKKLERTEAKLHMAIRAREDFLCMASHELRTPLTSLRLLYQHLVRSAPPGRPLELSSDKIERFLRTSERQFQRLAGMIDNLFDVSKLADGQVSLNLEELDLSLVVRECVDRMAPEIQATGSRVDVDLESPIVGHWDRLRVEQVVTNLVSNAARYGLGQPIRVAVRRAMARAVISVEDRGIGIDREAQAKLFQRFVRLTPDHHAGGLGLGLYICRTIVEAHRGNIRVESTIGKGSTFTVELPLRPLDGEERSAAPGDVRASI